MTNPTPRTTCLCTMVVRDGVTVLGRRDPECTTHPRGSAQALRPVPMRHRGGVDDPSAALDR